MEENKKLSVEEVLKELKEELEETGVTEENYGPDNCFEDGEYCGLNYAIHLIEENLLNTPLENGFEFSCPHCGAKNKVVW